MVTYGFFNSVYGDRKYDADQMSDFYTGIVTQGVFQHVDNGLEVTAGTGLTVSVNTGRAIIQNKWVKNDTPLILELAPAPTTYGRFDRVVLKYDSNNRNVQIIVKTGTPAGTPGVPELVREGGIYELCLADIDVEAGATSVTVTDTRSDTTLCGWASVAQAASGEVETIMNDIKIGYDGYVYSTPGDSVRGQVKLLEGKAAAAQNYYTKDLFTLDGATFGQYVNPDGTTGYNPYTGYTDYIDISGCYGKLKFSWLHTQYNSNDTHLGYFCDKNKNRISGFQFAQSGHSTDDEVDLIAPANAKYVVIAFYIDRKNDYYLKCNTKNSIELNNLFNTENAISGYFCRSENGTLGPASGVGVTDYIDISDYDYIHTAMPVNQTHQGALFDENYNYVSGYQKNNMSAAEFAWNIGIPITVPANAKYIRISYVEAQAANYFANGFVNPNKVIAKNRFSNMKMNCLGDSITYGYIPDSGAQMAAPFPIQVKHILGLKESRNYGISGSTLAVNSGNFDPMCVRYANMDNDADIVCLFGGTNDYGRGIITPTLGDITDTSDGTVYGALNIIAEGLIGKYPKAFIFFITPLRRADKTGDNAGGYDLEDVANAIKEVAHKYDLPVLDLYSKGGFHIENATFRSYYGGNDKLHPNQAFDTQHLAPMIAKFIESNM